MMKFLKRLITDETYINLWQWFVKKTQGHRVAVIFVLVLLLAFLAVVIINTPAWPDWTGLGDKTAWDLADLLLVPIVLAVGGYFLSRIQRKQDRDIADRERDTDREIAAAMEQERTLQSYIDAMKELLLDKNLLQSEEDDPVRDIAKTLTLAVIHRLDGKHNEIALRFLTAAKVIKPYDPESEGDREVDTAPAIINFRQANLRGINFNGMACVGLDLSEANLFEANLIGRICLRRTSAERASLGRTSMEHSSSERTSAGRTSQGRIST